MHYLSDYQTFQSKHELNEAVSAHLSAHCYELNDTDRDVLTVISRYAVKFAGVAHLKAETIAGLIGKSVKTARRAVNKLHALGIVHKVKTTRKVSGGQGANILQILPFASDVQAQVSNREQAVELTEPSAEGSENATEPYYSFNRNKDFKETDGALKRSIYAPIYNSLSPYFNDDEMYKAVGILYRAKASIDRNITVEDNADAFIDGFKAVIYSFKSGRVRSLYGCLYAAWRQVATEIKRRLTVRDSDLFYDWLA